MYLSFPFTPSNVPLLLSISSYYYVSLFVITYLFYPLHSLSNIIHSSYLFMYLLNDTPLHYPFPIASHISRVSLRHHHTHSPRYVIIVVGVRDNCMWFHIDIDHGATFWDNGKSYDDLVQIGISLLEQPVCLSFYLFISLSLYLFIFYISLSLFIYLLSFSLSTLTNISLLRC